jgi:ABC-type transport system substrate-binding protein
MLNYRSKAGISRTTGIVVIVVVVIIIIVGGLASVLLGASTNSTNTSSNSNTGTSSISASSSQSTSSISSYSSSSFSSSVTSSVSASQSSSSSQLSSSTTSASTSSSVSGPTTLTYETIYSPSWLDPAVLYDSFGVFLGNVYETLFFFNGSSTTQILPWLAQNYTVSPDSKTYTINLRSGITFADGEPFNSTSVYFTLNRVLVMDGSTPSSHATQFAPDFQQLLNKSLSSAYCGCHMTYNQNYVNDVLNENFVQITGPLSLEIHVSSPNSFIPFILSAYNYGMMLAPQFVMQHDLALWNQTSLGYTLPNPVLAGNETSQIYQYLVDEAATCNSGSTPTGCGTTYLDGSYQGSEAGTGPYILQSYGKSTNDFVFAANPNYWGAPFQYAGGTKIVPTFKTINMNFVPSLTTREIDLKNAAGSGKAMIIDVPPTNLYDVVDRNTWLNNGTFKSIIPGVSVLGPYSGVGGNALAFDMNVSNALTGSYYSFQPFADVRLRLAFSDSINVTALNSAVNNNLAIVSQNIMPPGTPPVGSYNPSILPRYSLNLTAVQDLLLSAMQQPLTHFTLVNGSAAPAGLFNNTFGCPTLNSNNQCSKPVAQTVTLTYDSGDLVAQDILGQMASAVNNVSATYNMGLTVDVAPVPVGYMYSNIAHEYTYYFQWSVDYPWDTFVLGFVLAPGHPFAVTDNWNFSSFGQLYQQALAADGSGNLTGLVSVSNEMLALSNQLVQYLPTFYYSGFMVMTSNIHGYYWNGALLPTLYFDRLT